MGAGSICSLHPLSDGFHWEDSTVVDFQNVVTGFIIVSDYDPIDGKSVLFLVETDCVARELLVATSFLSSVVMIRWLLGGHIV